MFWVIKLGDKLVFNGFVKGSGEHKENNQPQVSFGLQGVTYCTASMN